MSMLQIGKTLISEDIFKVKFGCNLTVCKGACCVCGVSGAPLEDEEIDIIEALSTIIIPILPVANQATIAEKGMWYIDEDHDKVTRLHDNKGCVFIIEKKGVATCAFEKAFIEGKTNFRKPISCHLYPIRISKIKNTSIPNYHDWDICKPAIEKGIIENISLIDFLKAPLIRLFGTKWYDELSIAQKLFNAK